MRYDLLEDAIIARLNPLKQAGFEILALPERDADFERPFKLGRVTVAYKSSLFNDDGMNGRPMVFSTNEVNQKETAEIEIVFQARLLRGSTGIHNLCHVTRRLLVGWRPDSWGRLYCKEYRFLEHADGVWSYCLTLNAQALVVQHNDPQTEVLISQITVDAEINP